MPNLSGESDRLWTAERKLRRLGYYLQALDKQLDAIDQDGATEPPDLDDVIAHIREVVA